MEQSEFLRTAIRAAKAGGEVLMRYYRGAYDVTMKNDDAFDPVTTADLESERLITKMLNEAFPGHRVLAEEESNDVADFSGFVWFVDPLDGTKEFVAHGDGFSVMIGLCKDGEPVLGVVYAPVQEALYCAEKGKGTYRLVDGEYRRLHVDGLDDLSQARHVDRKKAGKEQRPGDRLVESLPVREHIRESSIGLKLGLIAEQKAELHVNVNMRASKWDTCGPQVIIEEAGGRITDIDGEPLDYTKPAVRWERSFVASNGVLHEKIIALTKGFGPL